MCLQCLVQAAFQLVFGVFFGWTGVWNYALYFVEIYSFFQESVNGLRILNGVVSIFTKIFRRGSTSSSHTTGKDLPLDKLQEAIFEYLQSDDYTISK